MSHFVRCDNCPAVTPLTPGPHDCDGECAHAVWLLASDSRPDTPWLNFCSWDCLGAYATARALIGEPDGNAT